ncbi:hypothetical protein Syun_018892 [Stephania yunnanensis]|uniref:Uncharacterized protein n=1 Tax=Stephania yunnanensis TaxID=152371 RepID=A0AAP0IU73_9MAGN
MSLLYLSTSINKGESGSINLQSLYEKETVFQRKSHLLKQNIYVWPCYTVYKPFVQENNQ